MTDSRHLLGLTPVFVSVHILQLQEIQQLELFLRHSDRAYQHSRKSLVPDLGGKMNRIGS